MKKKLISVVCVLFLVGCAQKQVTNQSLADWGTNIGKYVPLHTPHPLPQMEKDFKKLVKDNQDVSYDIILNNYLTLEDTSFGTYQLTGKTTGDFVAVEVTAKNEQYRSILEFYKYRTNYVDAYKTPSPTPEGQPRYSLIPSDTATKVVVPLYIGVTIRIRADYQALSGGLNITGLNNIGLAADASEIIGSLQLKKAGMNSKSTSLLQATPDTLSLEAITSAITSFTTTKILLFDRDMVITPCYLGYYDTEGNDAFSIFAQTIIPQYLTALYGGEEEQSEMEKKDAIKNIEKADPNNLPTIKLISPLDITIPK